MELMRLMPDHSRWTSPRLHGFHSRRRQCCQSASHQTAAARRHVFSPVFLLILAACILILALSAGAKATGNAATSAPIADKPIVSYDALTNGAGNAVYAYGFENGLSPWQIYDYGGNACSGMIVSAGTFR